MAVTLAAAIVWFEPMTPPGIKPPFGCATGRHRYHRVWWNARECIEEAQRSGLNAVPWVSIASLTEAVG